MKCTAAYLPSDILQLTNKEKNKAWWAIRPSCHQHPTYPFVLDSAGYASRVQTVKSCTNYPLKLSVLETWAKLSSTPECMPVKHKYQMSRNRIMRQTKVGDHCNRLAVNCRRYCQRSWLTMAQFIILNTQLWQANTTTCFDDRCAVHSNISQVQGLGQSSKGKYQNIVKITKHRQGRRKPPCLIPARFT